MKIGTTQNQRRLFFNLKKEKEALEEQGFKPGPKLLAARLDVREEEVVEMQMRLAGPDISLDMPLDDETDATRMDFVPVSRDTVIHKHFDDHFLNSTDILVEVLAIVFKVHNRISH